MPLDFLLDNNGDLLIENGDFVISESTNQEIALITQTAKGEWKNDPLLGANLTNYLKQRDGQTGAIQEIKTQLKRDGKTVKSLIINENQINIEVNYENS